mgnify:CR=1 FL=1
MEKKKKQGENSSEQSMGPVLYCTCSWPLWRRKKTRTTKTPLQRKTKWANALPINGPCPILHVLMTLVEKKKDEDNKDPPPAQNEMGQRIAHQWRAPQVDLSPKRRGQKNALSPLGWKSGRERQNYRQPKTLPCRGTKIQRNRPNRGQARPKNGSARKKRQKAQTGDKATNKKE